MQASTVFGQSKYYTGRLEPEVANSLATTRQAGLHKDHIQASQIVSSLQGPVHLSYLYTSLHALAQIGSEPSLSEIERYIKHDATENSQDLDLSNFACAAKARLLSESKTQNVVSTQKQAADKIQTFFNEIGLSPDSLNSDLVSYNAPQTSTGSDGKTVYVVSSDAPKIHPKGVFAVREIADIVYHGRYEDYASLPQIQVVRFDQYYPAALKMGLAQVPSENRLAVIVKELSHKTALTFNDYYEIQLAINEGNQASEAAARELRKMDKHREDYDQIVHHAGFTAMFKIISGVGDKRQGPLFAYFMKDQDRSVAHYADIMHDDVQQGIKRELEPAY